MSRRSCGRRLRNCRSWLWGDGYGLEPFELHIFEEGPHGLAFSDQSSAEYLSQVYPDAAKWADLAGEWLKKRFALPLPEKSSFEKLLENGGI